jgi:hypothetical protein
MITLIAWMVSNFQQKSNNMLTFAGDRWYFFWQYFMSVVYVYVDIVLVVLVFAFLIEFIKHL